MSNRRYYYLVSGLAGLAASLGCESLTPKEDTLQWTLTPRFIQAAPGETVSFRIDVASKSNINADLDIQHSPTPETILVNLPASAASTADRIDGTIVISSDVEPGVYEVDINVREEGTSYGVPKVLELTVTTSTGEPDFTVEVEPLADTLVIEQVSVITYRVRPLNGFLGTVSISLTGLPDDVTIFQGPNPPEFTFAPGEGGKSGTIGLLFVPMLPVPPEVEATLTATGNGITHIRTIHLRLPFLPPSLRAVRGR